MTIAPSNPPVDTATVLCVDDNPRVAHALQAKLSRAGGFTWAGWLPTADDLVARTGQSVHLVVLDLDLPGADPFTAMRALAEHRPDVRVVIFSGHVRPELVDRAIGSGAWGYVSKNDGEDELLGVLRSVLAGRMEMSPEVRNTWDT